MKLKETSDKDLYEWMETTSAITGVQLPSRSILMKVCSYVRREFGEITQEQLDLAVKNWIAGEYSHIRNTTKTELNAFLMGQLLGEAKRQAQTRRRTESTYYESRSQRPDNYDEIMADGWEFQKEMLLEDKTIGWAFLSSLYEWANDKGKLIECSKTDIEATETHLERLFLSQRQRTLKNRLISLEAIKTSVPEWQRAQAAKVALSMQAE